MSPYQVKVNVLNYDKWHATCDLCDYRSADHEYLSKLVTEMITHSKEQHKPIQRGYPAPPKPSEVLKLWHERQSKKTLSTN